MQISTCQPILGLRINCKLITGFKSLTCKLFLGRDTNLFNPSDPATNRRDHLPLVSGGVDCIFI